MLVQRPKFPEKGTQSGRLFSFNLDETIAPPPSLTKTIIDQSMGHPWSLLRGKSLAKAQNCLRAVQQTLPSYNKTQKTHTNTHPILPVSLSLRHRKTHNNKPFERRCSRCVCVLKAAHSSGNVWRTVSPQKRDIRNRTVPGVVSLEADPGAFVRSVVRPVVRSFVPDQ